MYIMVDIPLDVYFHALEHGCEINQTKNNTIKKNKITKVPTPTPKTNESGLDIATEVGLAVGVIPWSPKLLSKVSFKRAPYKRGFSYEGEGREFNC
jgi:hypothetical protein